MIKQSMCCSGVKQGARCKVKFVLFNDATGTH